MLHACMHADWWSEKVGYSRIWHTIHTSAILSPVWIEPCWSIPVTCYSGLIAKSDMILTDVTLMRWLKIDVNPKENMMYHISHTHPSHPAAHILLCTAMSCIFFLAMIRDLCCDQSRDSCKDFIIELVNANREQNDVPQGTMWKHIYTGLCTLSTIMLCQESWSPLPYR